MTKVYELKKKFAAYFETRYCGIVVPMSFAIGAGSTGENKAELVVTDKFTQDAIEHDPRFGRLFFLAATYGEEEEKESETAEQPRTEPKAAPQPKKKKVVRKTAAEIAAATEGKTFKTMNDAIYYLEEELGIDASNANIESILKENNITVKDK